MAAVVSVFDGVRVNSSDSNTNWGNWGSGGGAPSSEDQLAYQGTAVNTKHGGTALDGIDYDPGASPVDMLLASRRLWFAKVIVSDSFDLNATHGVNLALGQSQSVLIEYNMAGSGAARAVYDTYPPQGGYLITAIDPRILAYRDSTTGTTDLSAIDWWGAQCAMIVGAAKGENLALDAIDIGRGWKLTRGDSTDADGEYQDFIDADQGTDSATTPVGRVGVITSSGPGIMTIHGLLTIGEVATATEFTDETGMVKLYPDGYHSAGSVGTVWNIENASTVDIDTATEIGQGQKDADQDTRPDIIVEGTAGSVTLDGKSITKARRVLYTNGVSAVGQALKECGQVDPTNSDYGGYQTLDGTGDYLSTSAIVTHTFVNGSDVEIIVLAQLTDWTPSTENYLFEWFDLAGDQYRLSASSGGLGFRVGDTAVSSSFSDTAISGNFVDGEWYWTRIVYDASVAQADFYWSLDPANTPPQDIVWIASQSPTGTSRTPTAIDAAVYVGANRDGNNEATGDIAYVSLWDGTVADGLQVWLADWRTGVDFTGGTPARPDGIQSVNWEENGNPVYTQGDDNTTAADLDGTSIADTTSYAALRWDVNADPDGELDNMAFSIPDPSQSVVTARLDDSTTTDGTSYTTTSISPSGDADSALLVFIATAVGSGTAPEVSTVVGNGVPYRFVDSQLFNLDEMRVTAFLARGDGATSGTIVITWDATMESSLIQIVEVSNTDGGAVVQTGTDAGTDTQSTVVLSAYGRPTNMAVGFAAKVLDQDFFPDTNFTEVYDSSVATPTMRAHSQWMDTSDTTITHGWTTSTSYGALGIELNSVAAAASHAIEFGKNTPASITLTDQIYVGYNASNGLIDSTFYNNTGGALTINLVGFTGNASYRNGVGATTTLVPNPVTLQLTAQDQGGTAIQSARVVVRAGSTGPLPYLDSVTITQTGGTATVSHTGHGLSTSDKVVIEGATNGNTREYNGIKTITVTGVDAYTYAIDSGTPSPATGTITSTAVIIDELTTAGGIADDTRSYSADQQIDPLRSYVRKSSSADDPKYRTSPVSGTIDKDTGLSLNILMIPDQ